MIEISNLCRDQAVGNLPGVLHSEQAVVMDRGYTFRWADSHIEGPVVMRGRRRKGGRGVSWSSSHLRATSSDLWVRFWNFKRRPHSADLQKWNGPSYLKQTERVRSKWSDSRAVDEVTLFASMFSGLEPGHRTDTLIPAKGDLPRCPQHSSSGKRPAVLGSQVLGNDHQVKAGRSCKTTKTSPNQCSTVTGSFDSYTLTCKSAISKEGRKEVV